MCLSTLKVELIPFARSNKRERKLQKCKDLKIGYADDHKYHIRLIHTN